MPRLSLQALVMTVLLSVSATSAYAYITIEDSIQSGFLLQENIFGLPEPTKRVQPTLEEESTQPDASSPDATAENPQLEEEATTNTSAGNDSSAMSVSSAGGSDESLDTETVETEEESATLPSDEELSATEDTTVSEEEVLDENMEEDTVDSTVESNETSEENTTSDVSNEEILSLSDQNMDGDDGAGQRLPINPFRGDASKTLVQPTGTYQPRLAGSVLGQEPSVVQREETLRGAPSDLSDTGLGSIVIVWLLGIGIVALLWWTAALSPGYSRED